MAKLRPIAIHLPQFHPVKENDEWWGKGFTEWTNVAKAKPMFPGHYQPQLPTDLGFYDLRLPDAREAQAELAMEYGIYGFCYYHYWFNGRRILERPVQEIVDSGKPDFPFMLCWANENWTRRWDGGDETVLLGQNYSESDALAHIKYLLPIFKDPRYIKIKGKPVFVFYRVSIIPNLEEYIATFRNEAAKEGLELYLCKMEAFGSIGKDAVKNLDASIEFQPFTPSFGKYVNSVNEINKNTLGRRINNKIRKTIGFKPLSTKKPDYQEYVDYHLKDYAYPSDYKKYPCVTPGWDNTARRGEMATLMVNNTPEKFEEWVKFHNDNFKPYGEDEDFIFINAWNEWAEGNHLEPCIKWGRKFLESLKRGLSGK
jgi:lipopolysaccharide biosynthesis protein